MSDISVRATSRGAWSTLRLLRTTRACLLILDLLLLILALNAVRLQRNSIRILGEDDVPAVIAAQHIELALEGMDGAIANELLQKSDQSPLAVRAYEEQRSEAVRAVMHAVEHDRARESGESSLEELELDLGTYERIAGVSRDLHSHGDVGLTAAHRQVTAYMDGELLPIARRFSELENQHLESVYKSRDLQLTSSRVVFGVFWLLAVLLFVITQTILSRRTRRTFNLALLGASVVMLAWGVHLLSELAGSHRPMAAAKKEASTTLRTLWQIEKGAYAADNYKSRYLLDAGSTTLNEKAFTEVSTMLATTPPELTSEQLDAALRERRSIVGFSGLLARGLAGASSSEERDALIGALNDWQQYVAKDAECRLLEHAGQHDRALKVCTGANVNQAHGVLARFNEAIGRAASASQAAFDADLGRASSALKYGEVEAGLGALIIAGLILLGFAPRLREYQG